MASLIAYELDRRQQRTPWLVSEIKAVGGRAALPELLWQQLNNAYWTELDFDVFVDLGQRTDGAWLREHDCLRGLAIRHLMVHESHESPSDFTKLIEAHPIKGISADVIEGADQIALALENCLTLREVQFYDSDLTDRGDTRNDPQRENGRVFGDYRATPGGPASPATA